MGTGNGAAEKPSLNPIERKEVKIVKFSDREAALFRDIADRCTMIYQLEEIISVLEMMNRDAVQELERIGQTE